MAHSKSLKTAAARVRAELGEIDDRIAALAREREDTQAAPLPADDFALLIVETIEHAAAGYVEQLHEDLRDYIAPAAITSRRVAPMADAGEHAAIAIAGAVLCTGQPPALARGGLSLEGKGLSLPAVWHFFGDVIRPKLFEAIVAMPDYPQDFGLARAPRAARLHDLDRQIEELEATRARLLSDVRQAGLQLA